MMKNLVREGVILSIIGLFVAIIYANTATGRDALDIANDSQIEVNTGNIEETETDTDDKNKLIKKTVYERRAEAPAAGAATKGTAMSKGSFTATAYCLRGRTATGQGVRRGIIAADPRVLRLGSRVSLGAGPYSGQYLVADTGGRIKGRKIDIWVPSCAEARRFGRRTVTIGMLQ